MKKVKQQKEKKLSLKKLQLMKIGEMNVIRGGDGNLGFQLGGGDDDPVTKPRTIGGGL